MPFIATGLLNYELLERQIQHNISHRRMLISRIVIYNINMGVLSIFMDDIVTTKSLQWPFVKANAFLHGIFKEV